MAIYRITLTGIRWGSVTMQNVLHFDDEGRGLTDDQVMIEMRDHWCTMWSTIQSNTFGWRNISIQRIGAVITPANYPIVVNGQDGVDNLGGTCVTNLKIRIKTSFPGKAGRGRFYLPAIRDIYWEMGQLEQNAINNLLVPVTNVHNRYAALQQLGPLKIGVLRRGGSAPDFHAATGLHMSLTPGIQRRRNVGVGV